MRQDGAGLPPLVSTAALHLLLLQGVLSPQAAANVSLDLPLLTARYRCSMTPGANDCTLALAGYHRFHLLPSIAVCSKQLPGASPVEGAVMGAH